MAMSPLPNSAKNLSISSSLRAGSEVALISKSALSSGEPARTATRWPICACADAASAAKSANARIKERRMVASCRPPVPAGRRKRYVEDPTGPEDTKREPQMPRMLLLRGPEPEGQEPRHALAVRGVDDAKACAELALLEPDREQGQEPPSRCRCPKQQRTGKQAGAQDREH